jgi:hypothetical protein
MVSMKIDPKAREDRFASLAEGTKDGPIYPYGLALTLDEDSLDKLDLELPKVGKSVIVYARAEVTSVSSNKTGEGERRSVSLQITDLSVRSESETAPDAAEKLYDGDKAEKT